MNRRSFLGLPLAAALAKQVMGVEDTTPVKWRKGTGRFKKYTPEEAHALLQRAMHRTYVKSCNFRGDKPPEAPALFCSEETWKAWKSWEA